MNEKENSYVGFEYLEIPAKCSMESLYVDSYENFGWSYEGNVTQEGSDRVTLKFKRDRKLRNKAELTRLQRQFEACAHEIETLERSRTTAATIAAFSTGLVGTAFLGGAMFAYLAEILPLMVVLAIPGFLGCIMPWFCYQKLRRKREAQIAPLIDQKNDEIYAICEQGCRLLNA